ncbi:hypothetical protein Ocin01_09396 [Orchesella cincta]|uniref:Uncharacterized protein n=1 Tax=Orchesella cincta TaxID=48709 RepID=A0A1D2MW45_ORCCI|nr:hypothetical protein Ocin01_09396 [Orchesella cincta]
MHLSKIIAVLLSALVCLLGTLHSVQGDCMWTHCEIAPSCPEGYRKTELKTCHATGQIVVMKRKCCRRSPTLKALYKKAKRTI